MQYYPSRKLLIFLNHCYWYEYKSVLLKFNLEKPKEAFGKLHI